MKSLQGRRTPGSRDECRTVPDGRQPLDQVHAKSIAESLLSGSSLTKSKATFTVTQVWVQVSVWGL